MNATTAQYQTISGRVLDFDQLRKVNRSRHQYWNRLGPKGAAGVPINGAWTDEMWIVALLGEYGEFANIYKKLVRGQHLADRNHSLWEALGNEWADVVIYIDLLMQEWGYDVDVATLNHLLVTISQATKKRPKTDDASTILYGLDLLSNLSYASRVLTDSRRHAIHHFLALMLRLGERMYLDVATYLEQTFNNKNRVTGYSVDLVFTTA